MPQEHKNLIGTITITLQAVFNFTIYYFADHRKPPCSSSNYTWSY